jgi:hypothetical protein
MDSSQCAEAAQLKLEHAIIDPSGDFKLFLELLRVNLYLPTWE